MKEILEKEFLDREDIIRLLSLTDQEEIDALFKKAYEVKSNYVGRKVYFRGLIEYSNICAKNCYYCGIRRDNDKTERYQLNDEEVISAAKEAYSYNYGSLVLQGGERSDKPFIDKIVSLLGKIHQATDHKLGITLSLGEQSEETYRAFFEAGAHRYLLRIETSSEKLYRKLHPEDHSFKERLECLKTLKRVGFQVGTGVMIGFPSQTVEDLADDLLFFREFDIHMVGMGPYIEHEDTPLWEERELLWSRQERFMMALKMVAVLRIMMKDINIAATTAMQAIDPKGREKALLAGANIIMPNLTPTVYRGNYLLYEDKPCLDEDAKKCKGCLEARIRETGDEIGYNQWGDSLHFKKQQ